MFSALKYLKSSVKIANKFGLTESVRIKSTVFENSIIFYTSGNSKNRTVCDHDFTMEKAGVLT